MGWNMDALTPPRMERLLAEQRWVRRLAQSLVVDPGTAEDLEQETWVRAARGRGEEPRSPRAWLGTVLRRLAGRHRRTDLRREVREARVARPERTPATDDLAARAEVHARIAHAVLALGEPWRTTILLRYFEDLPPRDVAARLGVPVATVRTRVVRGLELLRARLGEKDGGGGRSWLPGVATIGGGGEPAGPVAPDPASAVGGLVMGAKGKVAVIAVWIIVGATLGTTALWLVANGERDGVPRGESAGAPSGSGSRPGSGPPPSLAAAGPPPPSRPDVGRSAASSAVAAADELPEPLRGRGLVPVRVWTTDESGRRTPAHQLRVHGTSAGSMFISGEFAPGRVAVPTARPLDVWWLAAEAGLVWTPDLVLPVDPADRPEVELGAGVAVRLRFVDTGGAELSRDDVSLRRSGASNCRIVPAAELSVPAPGVRSDRRRLAPTVAKLASSVVWDGRGARLEHRLAPGAYVLVLDRDVRAPVAVEVSVTSETREIAVDVRLPSIGGSRRVRVLEAESGDPLVGAVAVAAAALGPVPCFIDGPSALRPFDDGVEATLAAGDAGLPLLWWIFAEGRAAFVGAASAAPDNEPSLPLRIPRTAIVEGRVVDAGGVPVVGTEVRWDFSGQTRSTKTVEGGRYRLELPVVGPSVDVVWVEDLARGAGRRGSARVSPGSTATLDFGP